MIKYREEKNYYYHITTPVADLKIDIDNVVLKQGINSKK